MPAASAAGVRSSDPALLQAAQLRRALEQLMATYSAASPTDRVPAHACSPQMLQRIMQGRTDSQNVPCAQHLWQALRWQALRAAGV